MNPHIIQLAISLGLGLLVGLQREHAESKVAGIRTFPIITMLGTILAWISISTDQYWLIGMGLLSMAILMFSVNMIQRNLEESSLGQTTEVAVLAMFSVGALIPLMEDKYLPVVIGGLIALLLYAKKFLAPMVDHLGTKDLKAIMQFAAISLIILPVLPDQAYGPYDVLNPRGIWWMVVLIVGISVVGYFVYQLFGDKVGTLSSGILGGVISSTATTVTFSRRSSDTNNLGRASAFIITAATAVSFIRILGEVAVVSPDNFGYVAPPIAALVILSSVICWFLYQNISSRDEKLDPPQNPAQLKSALIFGGLYALILLGVAWAEDYFGQSGLYAIALISGLTDVDAITLSLSHRMNSGSLQASFAWQLILLASLANLVFKGGLAIVLGGKELRKWISISFLIILILGLCIWWLWPETWHFA